ncbi:tRNA (adenosine(37)-N6)-threonylcarbamoyltransferase complex dimerization subunit type 1 TsaB [Actinospica durhamensis]|uniref:tRNA (Adenosine(37)-N6)-threonylcarbamoyltransferase complex dimerization subunit type 1 TsaB n=1 Tax=Actinospica durhamensis TaxID=1508375 RepID=A0A941EL79_9ACTN|nr:tRNA (adenosine(37)-N6)-threonylcarbamoyltransferase complex dimerization subunit type 1 TsaB [Actinospica durhamensis]MBR7832398.1 tRNA (adenosine(37)-N6)-threonylcarbamoyltransferase complex dimerization subunit type 1 TsaB [Actinospica durhamensis]
MLLLAFDTATPAVTVALRGEDGVLAEHTEVDARRHGELLAPGIERVLAAAGASRTALTAVAVGVGPGPFTGLRVGLMTARALGDALEIPVYGVCTLDILAAAVAAAGAEDFAVATDARRREVYWAEYDAHGRRRTPPAVDRPADIAERLAGRAVAGQGPALYPEFFPRALEPALPSAAGLAELTARLLAEDPGALLPPLPLYLRRPDAVEPGARKSVHQPDARELGGRATTGAGRA